MYLYLFAFIDNLVLQLHPILVETYRMTTPTSYSPLMVWTQTGLMVRCC